MRVGIPREVKNNEYRVAITPSGVKELVSHGHEVVIEHEAGRRLLDRRTRSSSAAGASILPTADDVWGTGELVLKVKEPVAEEYHRMRADQVLFTYLHLAASRACTDALLASGITGVAYETVQLPDLLAAAARADVARSPAGWPRRSARTASSAARAAAAC